MTPVISCVLILQHVAGVKSHCHPATGKMRENALLQHRKVSLILIKGVIESHPGRKRPLF